MMDLLKHKLAQFLRDERGTASVEFVLVVPPMLFVFIMAFESGMLLIRNVMLERGLHMALMELRMSSNKTPTFAEMRQKVCKNAVIFANCNSSLEMYMHTVNMDTWVMPSGKIPCLDSAVPINVGGDGYANPTDPNEVVIVRACIETKALFPGMYLGLALSDAKGRYWLTSVTAFVNEPG